MFSELITHIYDFSALPKMSHNLTAYQPPCKRCHTPETRSHVRDNTVINKRPYGIRNLSGIFHMMVGGPKPHYTLQTHKNLSKRILNGEDTKVTRQSSLYVQTFPHY